MELLDALTQTFDYTSKTVAGIRADQLNAATPCTQWDVCALVAHTIGVVKNMGLGVSGGELLPDINAITLDDDFAAQFRTEADRTLKAWTARGLEGEVNVGAGPMPAMAGLSINLVDTATHSWDIARATGQAESLPDDVAATVLAVCKGFVTEEIRGFAGFSAEVQLGPTATNTERLVAFLGRQP